MTVTDTVVIGAGHAGLAVSRLLTSAGRDHVVLDRGTVAERWRSERWDSLHLLTPNWMTRLPGWSYSGPDPEGYLSAGQLVRYLEAYAASFDAPVLSGTEVTEVTEATATSGRSAPRYRVSTNRGTWMTGHVVIATGAYEAPHVPVGVERADVLTSNDYRNPWQLPDGGVLVVGASSTGVQIADELVRAGRRVTLAVGQHTRMPRRYRGLDIFWWLQVTGRLARTIDEMPEASAARCEPSLQLVGRDDSSPYFQQLDLGVLQGHGVRLVGRLAGVTCHAARFSNDLRANVAAADQTMHRFLDAADAFACDAGLERRIGAAERPPPVRVSDSAALLDLRAERISTVLLATGYRAHHPWLRLPIQAADGSIRQYRGVTEAQGVYTVGQRFQHRRDFTFIDGARHDAEAVVGHLLGRTGASGVDPVQEPAA